MSKPDTERAREIDVTPGRLVYGDHGDGAAIVFVHGLLVNGSLWDAVVPRLAPGFRCITPDLPLGSHTIAVRAGADLSPPALADLIAELIERLDLRDVTLVGNDTGGALCQLVVTRRPERIARLVLTPSDAFENFPPRAFHYLLWAARVPGALGVLLQSMRIPLLRRSPIAFGWLAKRPVPAEIMESWVRPVLRDAAVRRDVEKVLRGLDPRHTLRAADELRRFAKPVLLAWPPEDRFFPFEHAGRLAGILPDARVEAISDSYTFVPLDQPARLAELIAAFARRPAALSA